MTGETALGSAGSTPWRGDGPPRLGLGTAPEKHQRKGCRSLDTAKEYGTLAVVAAEKTRTAKPAVRATCFSQAGVDRNSATCGAAMIGDRGASL